MTSIKKTVLAIVVMLGMGTTLIADMKIGTFAFDMKSTFKANGSADEQMTYLLKNMSKDINTVTVNKDKSVTLVGENRQGKSREEKFPYKKVSKNKYKIDAGSGIEITPVGGKQLKLGLKMQNGKMLHLLYAPVK